MRVVQGPLVGLVFAAGLGALAAELWLIWMR
jgi:hypothetical protein